MSSFTTVAEGLQSIDMDQVRSLQELCHFGSRSKGFHADGDEIRIEAALRREGRLDNPDRNLRNHYANKMMLIVGEVIEAHEQLRAGHDMTETYYPLVPPTGPAKPEGIPSELADAAIRIFDLAAEAGIDLASIIAEKLVYNASRGHMHGGKKF